MEWKSIETPPIGQGWYVVALNPPGFYAPAKKDYPWVNSWRQDPKNHAFEKAWFNGGQWFVVDQFAPKRVEMTNLVTHWAKLPDVPLFG